MRIKILTNSGYKYTGDKVSESITWVEIKDDTQGIIKIPISNISFMKELNE
jgi:hypothetical protein